MDAPAKRPPTRYAQAKTLTRPDYSTELHLELRRQGVVTIASPWGRIPAGAVWLTQKDGGWRV